MYCHFKPPFLDLTRYELDVNIVRIIPEEIAKEHHVIAIDIFENILTIGMINPEDNLLIDFLEQETKKKVIPFKISLSAWQEVIATAYIDEKQPTWIG